MRILWVMLLVVGGCVASIPADPGITADLAVEAARALVQLRAETAPAPPAPPAPGPRPGDQCQPCNGTGKLPTDGRVVIQCGACGGTGKVK